MLMLLPIIDCSMPLSRRLFRRQDAAATLLLPPLRCCCEERLFRYNIFAAAFRCLRYA